MKRFLLVALALVVGVNLSLAGDVMPKDKAGDKAWMFSFGGLSDLAAGNFMGGVGGKYFMSDNMAVRVGLGFATYTVTEKGTGGAPDEEITALSLSIAPGIQYNIASDGLVAAYVGGQVSFTTVSVEVKNPNHVANRTDKVSATVSGQRCSWASNGLPGATSAWRRSISLASAQVQEKQR